MDNIVNSDTHYEYRIIIDYDAYTNNECSDSGYDLSLTISSGIPTIFIHTSTINQKLHKKYKKAEFYKLNNINNGIDFLNLIVREHLVWLFLTDSMIILEELSSKILQKCLH